MDKILSVLKEIPGNPENETIQSLKRKIESNPSLESIDTLKFLKDLAYWLYVFNQKELSLKTTRTISDIPFTGNFDIWTWVQASLILQSRIYNENNEANDAKKCIETIKGIVSKMDESKARTFKKTIDRRLNGSLLKNDKINDALNNKNKDSEIMWRFSHFTELCFMKEMGGSDSYTTDKIEAEIQENLKILSENVVILY